MFVGDMQDDAEWSTLGVKQVFSAFHDLYFNEPLQEPNFLSLLELPSDAQSCSLIRVKS